MVRQQIAGRAALVATILAVLVAPARTGAQEPPAPTTRIPATELAVGSVVDAAVPRTGGSGLVTAVVTNGPTGSEATHVTLTYLIPEGATFDPTVPGATAGCTTPSVSAAPLAGPVVCDLGTIAPGGSVPVAIGVAVAPGEPVTLAGSFLPPRSDQFDPAAGELAQRTWYHEADAQGTTVQTCWPVEADSIRLEKCDDTPNPQPLVPDELAVLDTFPPPFSAAVTRSWEWRARIRPGLSGAHRVCADAIDDGAYVAIAPAGQAFTAKDVVLDVPAFGTLAQATVELEAGRDYDVLIRIVNRGAAGPDNGGRAPGGWGYVGVLPAISTCSPDGTLAFGTASASVGSAVPASIRVAASATVRVTGTVTDGTAVWSQANVVNDGPDAATVTATVTGQTAPIPPIELAAGAETVLSSPLEPGTVGVLGQDPWTVGSTDSLPPQS